MSNKMKKNQLKQVQNQSQSGRSMVEMLGVLAIIGVLSLGGIVGYRLAMNHYQANQIAHEMNMMRTDAKVKMVQGTENLTLGSPYDDAHKINFNGYGTDFGCALAGEKTVALDVPCYAANAYYIELQEIPESVCQPLARLINGMDNLIDFYVNDDAEGVGKDTCDEGNNTLTAIFGADLDSNAIKCGDPEDPKCPDNLPICLNHICVECETDDNCPYNTQYCENNVCKTCENGVWDGEEKRCVECLSSADCTNPDEPKCEESTNTCEPCPKNSFWDGEKCQEGCKTNNHCNSDEYCKTKKRPCGDDCTEFCPASPSGTCTKLIESDYYAEPFDTGKVNLYVSKIQMNHNTGLRFCEVLGRKLNITGMTMASVEDFECADPIDFSAEKQVDCCHKVSIGRPDVCGYQVSAISDVAHHFAQKFPWDDYWLIESYTNKYICAKANLYTGENPQIPEWSNFDSYTPALKYELRVICK